MPFSWVFREMGKMNVEEKEQSDRHAIALATFLAFPEGRLLFQREQCARDLFKFFFIQLIFYSCHHSSRLTFLDLSRSILEVVHMNKEKYLLKIEKRNWLDAYSASVFFLLVSKLQKEPSSAW